MPGPKNKTPWLALTILVAVSLAGCGTTATPIIPTPTNSASSPQATSGTGGAMAGKLNVIVTTTQIKSMAESVAGDLATVRSILPPGADAHDFEPKPSDVQAISESALVLKNGVGLDDWVDKIITNAGGQRPLVTVSEGVPLREASELEEGEEHEGEATKGAGTPEEHEGEEEHGQDPHVWFSVTNAMTMTRNIRDALVEVDPANAGKYDANTTAYLSKLEELDKYIIGQIATIPPDKRKIVTNHDAFGYYLERYGLQFVGSIIPSMSTEAQPSAQDVAELIGKIKSENIGAIFLESSISPDLAKQIGADAGVRVVDTLYGDSMGEPGSPGATYEGMMRFNTDAIVAALK